MTWLQLDSRAPGNAAAMLGAAFVLGCGVTAIATSGGSGVKRERRATGGARVAAVPATGTFADTPSGAIGAATAWCQGTDKGLLNGDWDGIVNALAGAQYRPHELRFGPVFGRVHRSLLETHTRWALLAWPLGYAVQQYSLATARVRVWQLVAIAIGRTEAVSEFTTTGVSLKWTVAGWKVSGMQTGPDLPPPSATTNASRIASWMYAAGRFAEYAYVP